MARKKPRVRRCSERLPQPRADLPPVYEFPAITVPPLRELGEREIPSEISKRQDFVARDLKPSVKPERIQALQRLAARPPVVKKLLGEKFIPIGIRMSEDAKQKSTMTVAMFYSYSNQIAVEAIFDSRGRVVRCEDYRYQPPATDEEIAQAVSMARRYLRKQDGWREDLSAGVIAITDNDPASPDYGRRLMDVRFFAPDERLAQLMAIVDLGKAKIARSGSVRHEGEQR
jgi:hypothetical protein